MDKVYAESHSALTHCATEKIITLQFQIQPCVTPLRAYIQELEKQSELKYPPTQIFLTLGLINKNTFSVH
jgi:hypothetical protein